MPAQISTFRIRIPGPWSDGWLYLDNLLLADRSGSMHQIRLRDLRAEVQRVAGPEVAAISDYLVLRNDWKVAAPFKAIADMPSASRAFQDSVDRNPEVILSSPPVLSTLSDVYDGFLLDSVYSYMAGFVGTTRGLFSFDFAGEFSSGSEQLLDTETLSLTASYGNVHASAGDEGLMMTRIEARAKSNFRYLADRSIMNTAQGSRLFNFPDYDSVEVLTGAVQTKDAVQSNPYIESYMRQSLGRWADYGKNKAGRVPSSPDGSTARLVGQAGNLVLVEEEDGLALFDLVGRKDRRQAVIPDNAIKTASAVAPEEVLSSELLVSGLALEYHDDVRLLTGDGLAVIRKGRIARMRGFPNSKQHKDMLIIVDNQGLDLVGVLGR